MLRGVAFDSLRKAPIDGALISIAGTPLSTFSDSLGRFRFDLAPGRYVLSLLHASLDSIGLSGVSATVVLRSSADSIVLAIPSFGTLWRAACGKSTVPSDSGFILGTVQHADRREPVRNATVSVTWVDFGVVMKKKANGITQERSEGAATRLRAPCDER